MMHGRRGERTDRPDLTRWYWGLNETMGAGTLNSRYGAPATLYLIYLGRRPGTLGRPLSELSTPPLYRYGPELSNPGGALQSSVWGAAQPSPAHYTGVTRSIR